VLHDDIAASDFIVDRILQCVQLRWLWNNK